jgi:hypothetical protein
MSKAIKRIAYSATVCQRMQKLRRLGTVRECKAGLWKEEQLFIDTQLHRLSNK